MAWGPQWPACCQLCCWACTPSIPQMAAAAAAHNLKLEMLLRLLLAPGQAISADTALRTAVGVTTEAALLHPENGIHPDFYMSQLSDLLSIKEAPVAA